MASSSAVPILVHENGKVDRVVVIAASAGGIEALIAVLCGLPADFPAPILIVLHRRSARPGMLAKILQRDRPLPVRDAKAGEHLESGIVYITPADLHTQIAPDQSLMMGDHAKINFLHASADPLFRSAAASFGGRAIGVVLSGRGRNGTAGAKAFARNAGGVVIAQNEETAQFFAMPHAAIEAGAVTDILPLGAIADSLVDLVVHSGSRR